MNHSSNLFRRTVNGCEYSAIVLQAAGAIAEIWPALGGNCVRWATDSDGDFIWSPPLEELVNRATRGGNPVLFPFPNRIRAGRYSFSDRSYQLACNDSTNANAIHGFAPRAPWQVVATTNTTAELSFRLQRDDPANTPSWPGDLELMLSWQLAPNRLSCQATVTNHGDAAAPFGLGFHPYFRSIGQDDRITIPATKRWELLDGLPTGSQLPVDGAFDLRAPRRVGELRLDDVYTELAAGNDVRMIGQLMRADGVSVSVLASGDFREVVVFTPPHGRAVCLEPYTCPTDAANLAARGTDVGWKVLGAKSAWQGEVQYELSRG